MTTPFRNPGGAALTGAMPNREIDVTRANTIIERCVINTPSCSRLPEDTLREWNGPGGGQNQGIPSEDPFAIQFAAEPRGIGKYHSPRFDLSLPEPSGASDRNLI